MNEGGEGEFTYEKACKIRTMSTYVGSALLLLVCIMKIISVANAPPIRTFITCFYLIALAIIMGLVEYGNAKAQ